MPDLLVETRAQLAKLDRFAVTMVELRLVRWLLVLAGLASLGWATGTFLLLLDLLPNWALMAIAMPLFGSMIAVYTLGGLAALSIVLSVGLDLAFAPFRKGGPTQRGTQVRSCPVVAGGGVRHAGQRDARTGS